MLTVATKYPQRLAAFAIGILLAASSILYAVSVGLAFAVAVCGILLGD